MSILKTFNVSDIYEIHFEDVKRALEWLMKDQYALLIQNLNDVLRRGKENTSIGIYNPVEVQREYPSCSISNKEEKGVAVYVMMPLDSVTMWNSLNNRKAVKASFKDLKSAGVEEVMVDVWWGLVEEVAR
nr:beta-amylase 1, chloroplastic [Tanacetum cinerariifolium]